MNIHTPSEKAQGLVEYAMILILVAVMVIVVLFLIGPAGGADLQQRGGDGVTPATAHRRAPTCLGLVI